MPLFSVSKAAFDNATALQTKGGRDEGMNRSSPEGQRRSLLPSYAVQRATFPRQFIVQLQVGGSFRCSLINDSAMSK